MVDSEDKQLQEKFRESASLGDFDAVKTLTSLGVNVNSKNTVNGWTALHWASKRNHRDIVKYLLEHGADKDIQSVSGEKPSDLTTQADIQQMFGTNNVLTKKTSLPIIPNYLMYPSLIEKVEMDTSPKKTRSASVHTSCKNSPVDELVLKVRVANYGDPDFIEIELPKSELTFHKLVRTCCDELNINPNLILKIRKLPNTILRKDKDIQRLSEYQEIEFLLTSAVVTNGTVPQALPTVVSTRGNIYESIYLKRDQTVLY